MNIKEIIDKERWGGSYGAATSRGHNASLDNIESNVTAYVAEMEEALDVSYNAEREALKKRIAELEAQIENLEKLTIVQENLPVPNLRRRIAELVKESETLKQMVIEQKQRIADFDTALSASLARENAYRERLLKQLRGDA